jgi:hypothetical protein
MISTLPDIITYSFEEFIKYRNAEVSLPANIRLKIDEIINGYACFKDGGGMCTTHKHYDHKPRHFPRGVRECAPRSVLKRLGPHDDKKREIRGIYNKLTNSNFDILSRKIMRYIDPSSIDMALELLLECAFREHAYIPLYVQLLQKMHQAYPSHVVTSLQTFLQGFEEAIRREVTVLTDACVHQYDGFCEDQKNKHATLGRTKMLSLLMVTFHNYLQFTHRELLELIMTLMSECMQCTENPQVQELFAQMLLDYIEVTPAHLYDINNIIQFVDEDELKLKCTSRTRFKLMDIKDLCHKLLSSTNL